MSDTVAKQTAYTLLGVPHLSVGKTTAYTAFLATGAAMVAKQTAYVALFGTVPLRRRPLFLF